MMMARGRVGDPRQYGMSLGGAEGMTDKEGGGARSTDPRTSHIAAAHVDVSALRAMYIAALKRTGHPLTTTEIGEIWGRSRDSFSPRSTALLEDGLIMWAGDRRCKNFQGNWMLMQAYGLPEWREANLELQKLREARLAKNRKKPKPEPVQ
jgi:hypothetical protein